MIFGEKHISTYVEAKLTSCVLRAGPHTEAKSVTATLPNLKKIFANDSEVILAGAYGKNGLLLKEQIKFRRHVHEPFLEVQHSYP